MVMLRQKRLVYLQKFKEFKEDRRSKWMEEEEELEQWMEKLEEDEEE